MISEFKVPAYVITLKEDITKISERISEVTNGKIYPIRKFKATNGKDPLVKVKSSFVNCFFNEYLAPPLLVAIADSHMRAWETFIFESTEDDDICVFFEDDVFARRKDEFFIDSLFSSTISDFKEAKGDILYLGYFKSCFLQLLMSIVGAASFPCGRKGGGCTSSQTQEKSGKLIRPPKLAVGLHAYALTRRGALNLLWELKGKVNQYLDFKIQKLNYHKRIRAFVPSKRRIFYQTSTATECEKEQFCGSGSGNSNLTSSSCQTYPTLVTDHLLKNVKVDECFSGRYVASNVLFHLFGSPYFKVTVATLYLLLFGSVLALLLYFVFLRYGQHLRKTVVVPFVLFFLFVLGIPDFALSKGKIDVVVSILFNIFAFILPFLLLFQV